MTLDLQYQLRAERTPNPHSVKWVVRPALRTEGRVCHFRNAPGDRVSPLAEALLSIAGISEVLITDAFVTVTKSEEAQWPALAEALSPVLRLYATEERPAFGPDLDMARDLRSAPDPEALSPVAREVRDFLDREIRPLVAQDGGEVLFVDFQEGRVSVLLQGACSGCPSSTQTLKFGIEERLRAAIPAVREGSLRSDPPVIPPQTPRRFHLARRVHSKSGDQCARVWNSSRGFCPAGPTPGA